MSMIIKQLVKAKQSEDFVKQALGVERLTGDALKNHPNYAFYLKFMTKAENHKLDKWLKDEVSTYRAWLNLGLLGLSFDLYAAQLKDTHAFMTYVRYATMYGNKMWRTLYTLSQPPIYYEGSPAELETKVQVWAKAKSPKEYVKKMLGLDLVPANAVKSQPDYKYYPEFLRLAKRTDDQGRECCCVFHARITRKFHSVSRFWGAKLAVLTLPPVRVRRGGVN